MNPHKERLKNAAEQFIEAKKVIKVAIKLSYIAFTCKFRRSRNHKTAISGEDVKNVSGSTNSTTF